MGHIFQSSLIIGIAFGVNKLLALIRQYAIAAQFGFSPDIDAFNVANNLPDLVFSLFSGGALAMAFIPVFAEYIDVRGRDGSWKLFSNVTTLICALTALASALIALFAPALVQSSFGVAPGFTPEQQALTVTLLRINLIATMIFSISGLVTASLQAHRHFLLPALAPLLYNVGIIFGAMVLAPRWGVYGLTWGVVLGALLHLLIQLPALRRFNFRLSLSFTLADAGIRKILHLMGPRVLTVLLINITFLLRDNLASRLAPGSVSALTYGYFIMQVPETLIGTSIATALLPTLSLQVSQKRREEFARALTTATQVLVAASILPAVLSLVALAPLISLVFTFSPEETALLTATTNAFMLGLLAQTLLEVFVRAFYARQQAMIPLYTTLLRTIVFILASVMFYRQMGATGLAAIDSATVALQTGVLFILLLPVMRPVGILFRTVGRSLAGGLVSFGAAWILLSFIPAPILLRTGLALLGATLIYLPWVRTEMKLLPKL